jgi:hypothetical protein
VKLGSLRKIFHVSSYTGNLEPKKGMKHECKVRTVWGGGTAGGEKVKGEGDGQVSMIKVLCIHV